MSDPRRHDERGSITVWLAMFSLVVFVLIGLVVDGGGTVRTQQRAQDLAAQAARVAGEEVQPDPAISGQAALIQTSQARRAGLAYLTGAGVTGSVTIRANSTVTVQVVDHYQPVFLTLIGVGRIDVTATATAQLNRVLEGQRR